MQIEVAADVTDAFGIGDVILEPISRLELAQTALPSSVADGPTPPKRSHLSSFPTSRLTPLIVFEDLVIVMLAPLNVRCEASKLPDAIDSAILHRCLSVRVAVVLHFRPGIVLVLLMRYTHLMLSSDFVVGNLHPFASSDHVLGRNALVSKKMLA